MGCKLAKYLGEASVIGCFLPCSLQYLRTKLRTARRIEVRSNDQRFVFSERTHLGFLLW